MDAMGSRRITRFVADLVVLDPALTPRVAANNRICRVPRPAWNRLDDFHRRLAMTNPSMEQLFRQAAEAEGGMSVSAGARVAHVRLALESGRAISVDLSEVPEDR